MKTQELKSALFYELREIINKRIITINRALRSAKKARDNETKSTAGDKHNTSRAMMQNEESKLKISLSKTLMLKAALGNLELNKSNEKVSLGSVVETDNGDFFVSVGLGKVMVKDKSYFAISLRSPIGERLLDKKVGDTLEFRGLTYTIKTIL